MDNVAPYIREYEKNPPYIVIAHEHMMLYWKFDLIPFLKKKWNSKWNFPIKSESTKYNFTQNVLYHPSVIILHYKSTISANRSSQISIFQFQLFTLFLSNVAADSVGGLFPLLFVRMRNTHKAAVPGGVWQDNLIKHKAWSVWPALLCLATQGLLLHTQLEFKVKNVSWW